MTSCLMGLTDNGAAPSVPSGRTGAAAEDWAGRGGPRGLDTRLRMILLRYWSAQRGTGGMVRCKIHGYNEYEASTDRGGRVLLLGGALGISGIRRTPLQEGTTMVPCSTSTTPEYLCTSGTSLSPATYLLRHGLRPPIALLPSPAGAVPLEELFPPPPRVGAESFHERRPDKSVDKAPAFLAGRSKEDPRGGCERREDLRHVTPRCPAHSRDARAERSPGSTEGRSAPQQVTRFRPRHGAVRFHPGVR